jgi:hypothetical protein
MPTFGNYRHRAWHDETAAIAFDALIDSICQLSSESVSIASRNLVSLLQSSASQGQPHVSHLVGFSMSMPRI